MSFIRCGCRCVEAVEIFFTDYCFTSNWKLQIFVSIHSRQSHIIYEASELRRHAVEMHASAITRIFIHHANMVHNNKRYKYSIRSDLWPLTLKTFSATPTHMMNIRAKFHGNRSTKYRDIVSREIGVNGRTTDGRQHGGLENIMPPPRIARWRHKKSLRTHMPWWRERQKGHWSEALISVDIGHTKNVQWTIIGPTQQWTQTNIISSLV